MRRILISFVFILIIQSAIPAQVIDLGINTKVEDHPIIFMHGRDSNPEKAIYYWYGEKSDYEKKADTTSLEQIVNQNYRGYTFIDSFGPFANLSSTNGNVKVIYNFTFYDPDDSYDDNCGAIGSNGNLLPIPYQPARPNVNVRTKYSNRLTFGTHSKRLSDFIDKVIQATGAKRVDIVTHSMGGLVVRSAIKWHGAAPKIHKLLMIGTPNHGITGPSPWTNIAGPGAFKDGEDLELDSEVEFIDVNSGDRGSFTELLNRGDWSQGVKYANIIGNRKPPELPNFIWPDDSVVNIDSARLDGAEFNAIYYASHGSLHSLLVEIEKENSLTACLYTTEFIKFWIIDDSTEHNGAYGITSDNTSQRSYPNPWTTNDVKLFVDINDYNKALITRVAVSGNTLDIKEIPIYLTFRSSKKPDFLIFHP